MLTQIELYLLVNDYIGGEGGYLGDFTWATHAEFYPHFCGLSVDPAPYREAGLSIRKTFIKILEDAAPADQARIIHGALKKFPIAGFPEADRKRKGDVRRRLEMIAERLQGGTGVESDSLSIHNSTVQRALEDAVTLLRTTGAASGVDRVHTALHGYLMAICRESQVAYEERATLNDLLKRIIAEHPALQIDHPRTGNVRTILKSLGSMLDSLNPIRNQASVAHPNEHLLEEAEAWLVIDSVRTVLNYLNRKLASN